MAMIFYFIAVNRMPQESVESLAMKTTPPAPLFPLHTGPLPLFLPQFFRRRRQSLAETGPPCSSCGTYSSL